MATTDRINYKAREAAEAMGFPALAALVARCAARCAACGAKGGAPGVRLSACPKCQGVSYCGKSCQRAAWPTHGPVCQVRAEARVGTAHK